MGNEQEICLLYYVGRWCSKQGSNSPPYTESGVGVAYYECIRREVQHYIE